MSVDEVRTLYNDRFAPVTSSIGFLHGSLDEVAEGLRRWRAKIHGSAERISLAGGLAGNVHRLEPLTGGVRPRELLVATKNREWTALFDCGVQGGDQTTTVGFMSRTLQLQGVVVVSIPDRKGGHGVPDRFGALQFELFGPIATDFLNYVRTVSLVRDGARWRFDANGTVQDFEDVSAYRRPKVAERFTPSLLASYAQALGLDAFDEGFYHGPSALIVNPAAPPPGALVLNIEDAQRRTGIVVER